MATSGQSHFLVVDIAPDTKTADVRVGFEPVDTDTSHSTTYTDVEDVEIGGINLLVDEPRKSMAKFKGDFEYEVYDDPIRRFVAHGQRSSQY